MTDLLKNIDITISINNQTLLFNGVEQILSAIRPEWLKQSIQLKSLSQGLTNALVQCQLKDDSTYEDVILVRIYGENTDLLINREQEKRNIILLQNAGIAPPLYAAFNNGLAYKYIDGYTLSPTTVIQPKIYKLVAAQMAHLHLIQDNVEQIKVPSIWNKTIDFLNLVQEIFVDEDKQTRFNRTYPGKAVLLSEINQLRSILENCNSPIVLAHNDLLLGNIIFNQNKNTVTFIDFEYCSYNYQAYDIANHFAEFIGTDNIDVNNYPTKELQYDWLSEYLAVYNSSSSTYQVDIDQLYILVNEFALLSHIFWGIWSLIQASYSKIDFDYIGYAQIRFDQYFKKKNLFLSLNK